MSEYPAESVGKQDRERSPIERQLARLSDEAHGLDIAIDRLAQRLSPVLLPRDDGGEEGSVPRPVASPLFDEVGAVVALLDRLGRRVRYLEEALEI